MSGNSVEGQDLDGRRTFEVVSLKPSAPQAGRPTFPRITGGPGARDPSRFTTEKFSLYYLISSAFNLKSYQIAAPAWTETALFDVAAKIPEGTSKDQFRAMLQNMLSERFNLRTHLEIKEINAYELVTKPAGAKRKPEQLRPDTESKRAMTEGMSPVPEGDATRSGYQGPAVTLVNGNHHLEVASETMEQFSVRLSNELKAPVSNKTELGGAYKIGLTWARQDTRNQAGPVAEPGVLTAAENPSGPSIFSALQEQLGLKLVPRKVPVNILVVDSINKLPTEN